MNATVKWVNEDVGIQHTVTADNGNAFNSLAMSSGQSYTFTFTTPGTYTYHCFYHTFMHGTVIVKASAVPEFPISALAPILFGVIAAAALASGRFRTNSSTYKGKRQA